MCMWLTKFLSSNRFAVSRNAIKTKKNHPSSSAKPPEPYNSCSMRFFIVIVFSAATVMCVSHAMQCPNCGRSTVPYPLSTGPGCGVYPLYNLRCVAGALFLINSTSSSLYPIAALDPVTRRITLHSSAAVVGFRLGLGSQFRVPSGETILILNCTARAALGLRQRLKANCSLGTVVGPGTSCSVRIVGRAASEEELGVWAGPESCSGYRSLPGGVPEKWPEPSIQLEWNLPREPVCSNGNKKGLECKELFNSKCLIDLSSKKVVQNRCLCNVGFNWDPNKGVCQPSQMNVKCSNGKKGCKMVKKKKKSKHVAALAGAVAGIIPVLIGIGIIVYKQQSRKKSEKEAKKTLTKEREQILNSKTSGKSARIFTGKEMTKATGGFSKSNLIGSGGFGEVFKGVFEDGTLMAIKRAKLGNTKGVDQILNEVRILCQVNHRSLVRLLGCCVELDTPLLVSEFVPNGTLFDHLHRRRNAHAPPSWMCRLRIAHQTAEGLSYLHSAASPPIYHRDVKSSNILLDNRLDAKVSDFGLSRLVEPSESQNQSESHIFTCVQGTLGYLDPEYYLNFQLTDKSDVYSFGVVLLEILTGMKAIDFTREEEEVNLVVYAKKLIKRGTLMEAVDPTIREGCSRPEAEALGALAASCLSDNRQTRPSMKQVADQIENLINLSTNKVVS